MPDIQFDFEELPLVTSRSASGITDQCIALLSGHAEINFEGSGEDIEWAIIKIYIDSPLAGHKGMDLSPPAHTPTLNLAHYLWAPVACEIERRYGDDIVEKIEEAARPDPDMLRDMRREAA